MNEQFKSGFATLIGRPNVGKSTLMNTLIGQKIAITSNKPQTTRNRIQTVYTCEQGQIVFLDTPGIHKSKNKLGDYMVNVAQKTLSEVDVVLWLVEPSTYIGAGEQQQRPAAPLLQYARHGEPGVEMSAGSAAGDGQCQFGHHSSSLRFRYWRSQGRKESFARIEF